MGLHRIVTPDITIDVAYLYVALGIPSHLVQFCQRSQAAIRDANSHRLLIHLSTTPQSILQLVQVHQLIRCRIVRLMNC